MQKKIVAVADEIKNGKVLDDGAMFNLNYYFVYSTAYEYAAYGAILPIEQELADDYGNFWKGCGTVVKNLVGIEDLTDVAITAFGEIDYYSPYATIVSAMKTNSEFAEYKSNANLLLKQLEQEFDSNVNQLNAVYDSFLASTISYNQGPIKRPDNLGPVPKTAD